jgi:hypothetical protein
MNGSYFSQGAVHMDIGNEHIDMPINIIPNPAIRTLMYNAFVQTGYTATYDNYPFVVPSFNRFSNLRYYKDKNYLEHLYKSWSDKTGGYEIWLTPSPTKYRDPSSMREYFADTNAILTTNSISIGSAGIRFNNTNFTPIGEYPNGNYGFPLITSVDIPGTTIGNLFKHPIGRSANFNEVGQIALSQGSIAITGVYDPPESKMFSATYQIYYTKSGGTGIIVGGTKTTGEAFPATTNNYTFKDTTFAGFVPGDADGNHYIAIRSGAYNIGTFKVVTYIDANTVETDAVTINQSFTNESSLTWTMRTGPIGEYFFRRHRYVSGTTWWAVPQYNMAYSNAPMHDTYGRAMSILSTLTNRENIVSIHDRGVCRWTLADHGAAGATYAPYGLARWVEMSNHGLDYPYLDNDITNLPTGIIYWRDMDIDGTASNKLWIGIDDSSTSVGYSLFKIDPYPSGNARYPDCVAKFSKQTNAADANGLPSKNVRGVCCDTFNNRIWALCGNDSLGGDGGIAYTENSGTTWNRMHKLSSLTGTNSWNVAGDGVTVTNPALDAALLTELAVRDWVTFSGTSKRQILSVDNNNQFTLTAATSFGGVQVGLTLQKGCLANNQCRLLFISAITSLSYTDGYIHPPCDYDTDGILYWVPDLVGGLTTDPAVCRINPNDTTMPETRTNAQLSGGQTFQNARSVTVTKFSNIAGSGVTTFQNNIWVGSYQHEVTRIYNWGATSITRYHHSSTNSWPTSINLSFNGPHYNTRVIQDLKTGQVLLTVQAAYYNYPDCYVIQTQSKNTHTTFGQTGTPLGGSYYNLTTSNGFLQAPAYISYNFDDIGLGGIFIHHYPDPHVDGYPYYTSSSLTTGYWTCFRWNGSSWNMGIINGYWSNIDFAGVGSPAGPHTECTVTCGVGSQRVMEIETPLDNGLYIKFVQAGGGTLQTNEFIVDENTTYTCSIGRVKDNTMTASYNIDSHAFPTIVRLDEPTVQAGSLWTLEDGIDGGYIDNATDTTNPIYMRGVSEYTQFYATATTNYPNMTHVWNGPSNPHYLAARRIHETCYDAGDLDIWNDTGVGKAQCPTGTYTFGSGDINKTVRVHGALTGGNNTSKLITAVDTGTNTITLSSAWAADENDRKWTLRLIPAVGYVALVYQSTTYAYEQFLYQQYKLHSSINAGINWDAVKSTKYFSGVAANDPITKVGAVGYIDAGVFCDPYGLSAINGYVRTSLGDYVARTSAIVFDIRELSQEARRRTHWKIHRENVSSLGGNEAYVATIILLDENYVPMGPSNLFTSDRDDSRYVATFQSVNLKAVMYESVNAATGIDMSYGYLFTDVIQVGGGESFYEQNNTDLIAYANTTQVESSTAIFSISSVNKKLRVPLLSVSGGTYDGFVTIDTFVNSTTILVNRTIASQANGSITSVTNNGGQAVFNSASHTLVNGDAVTITSTTNYNGNWIAANVVAGVSFEVGTAYVSSQTGTWNKGQTGLTWALTNFAPTDKVRFDDTTTFFKHIGRPITCVTYTVLDIPASNQIKVTTKDIPLSINSTFNIERDFTTFSIAHQQAASWDTTFSAYISYRSGCMGVSDSAQFNLIQEDSATETATSSADTDGDGWTNEITLTGITLSAQAVADDWILLYKTTGNMYRRWYKIKSITGYGPGAVLKTYEDEITPSTTFKWKVCRKRGLKMRIPAVTIVASSQI